MRKGALLFVIAAVCLICQCASFTPTAVYIVPRQRSHSLAASSKPSTEGASLHHTDTTAEQQISCQLRRSFIVSLASTLIITPTVVNAEGGKLGDILGQLKDARVQLEGVPDLIKSEKWDAIRAILVKPPLSNMWTSGGQNKLLNNYADAIGNELPDGDEIAALELREDLISHLRYLDMAVYNNVFNPIATEGQSGVTKELVRSYYEDPINEWKASKSAIDDLIKLASP